MADRYECLAHLLVGRPPARPIRGETEWTKLTALADREGVAPLLYRALTTLPSVPVPETVRATLAGAYRDAVYASLLRESMRTRLCRSFHERTIPILLLKGAALALTCYDDPATRLMHDLDILAPASRLEEAAGCLEEAGFQLLSGSLSQRRGHHLIFSHAGNGTVVELHWQLKVLGPAPEAALAEIWADARPIGKERQAQSMRPGHMIPLLCAHMTLHHRYARLLWLFDLHRVLLATDQVEAAAARDAAVRWRLGPCTALGLLRTRHLLDTALPGELGLWAETTAARADLQARVAALALLPGRWKRPTAHLVNLVRKGNWSLIETLFPTPDAVRQRLGLGAREPVLPAYVALVGRRLRKSPAHLRDLWDFWRSVRQPRLPTATLRHGAPARRSEEPSCSD